MAVWLAEGKSVRDMAEATGHTEGAIYWHLKQIYRKHSISRQVDLVRCGWCYRSPNSGEGGAAGVSGGGRIARRRGRRSEVAATLPPPITTVAGVRLRTARLSGGRLRRPLPHDHSTRRRSWQLRPSASHAPVAQRRDPTLAAHVAELNDTGHAATPRHAARVSRWVRRSRAPPSRSRSGRPRTDGQRMVVRVPPHSTTQS